jgi:peptidyl-prolyl cis-trans isomerase C
MFAVLLALTACDSQPGPEPAAAPGAMSDRGETVLTVNGTPIGSGELGIVFRRMRVPEDKVAEYAFSRGGKHVAEEYALATVLYDKALAEGLDKDPKVELEMAFAVRQVLATAMRNKLADTAVTEEAIQKYYEDNKARFSRPEVKARHIQLADEPAAKDALARLKKGEKFEELAKTLSLDRLTKDKGGEVTWFHEKENPLWGDAAFAAEKGAIVGPISSRLGWHVVEVLDKRDATPLEDVREEAAEQIKHQQSNILVDEVRKSMKIEWAKTPDGGAPSAESQPTVRPPPAVQMPAAHPTEPAPQR